MSWEKVGDTNVQVFRSRMKSIQFTMPFECNLKLWRNIKPPEGWSKRCKFNRRQHSVFVFRALIETPNPPDEWFEEMAAKFQLMQVI
jgi:hypothetical protein